MKSAPAAHVNIRNTRVGLARTGDFFARGTSAGRPGEGGGEKKRWLRLKRDPVAEPGAFSC